MRGPPPRAALVPLAGVPAEKPRRQVDHSAVSTLPMARHSYWRLPTVDFGLVLEGQLIHKLRGGRSCRPVLARRGRAVSTRVPRPTSTATNPVHNKTPPTSLHLLSDGLCVYSDGHSLPPPATMAMLGAGPRRQA
jgi:hypothetical protein